MQTVTFSCKIQVGYGSVQFDYGLGMERFGWFRFSAQTFPLYGSSLCISMEIREKSTVLVLVSFAEERFRRFRLRFRLLLGKDQWVTR